MHQIIKSHIMLANSPSIVYAPEKKLIRLYHSGIPPGNPTLETGPIFAGGMELPDFCSRRAPDSQFRMTGPSLSAKYAENRLPSTPPPP